MRKIMTRAFPASRPRRIRFNHFSRNLVRENKLSSHDLVLPVFMTAKSTEKTPIDSMPGVYRLGESQLMQTAEKCLELEIPAIALFPVITEDKKTIQH